MKQPRLPRPVHPGIYAIANCDNAEPQHLLGQISASLEAGAAMLQLRAKTLPQQDVITISRQAKRLCDRFGALLIINDDPAVAHLVEANGVHIGRDDPDCERIRSQYGEAMIIGVSCYDLLDRARAAVAAGADYIAFGSVFDSPTKPNAPRCDLQVIKQARQQHDVPIVAIGGITPANAPSVTEAGADFLAVISGIFEQANAAAATREYISAI